MQGKFPVAAAIVAGFMCVSTATAAENEGSRGLIPLIKSWVTKSEPEIPEAPKAGKPDKKPKKNSQPNRRKMSAALTLPTSNIPVPEFRPENGEVSIQEAVEIAAGILNGERADENLPEDAMNGVAADDIKDVDIDEKFVAVAPVAVSDVNLRKPLGFSDFHEEEGLEGVAYHLNNARALLYRGEIGLAREELVRAKDVTTTIDAFNEVEALEVVANVLVGHEDQRSLSDRKQFADWAVIELVRSTVAGARTAYSGQAALDEFLLWPDHLVSLAIHNLALAVRHDQGLTAKLLEKAHELHKDGKVDKSILNLMTAYASLASKDLNSARAAFASAEGSIFIGIGARAKLEGLMMDLSSGALQGERVIAVARDIANARTNDFVERAAWRVMADRQLGLEKVHSLRKLEQLETDPQRRQAISNELNATLEMETARKDEPKVDDRSVPAPVEKVEAEEAAEDDNSDWLLDEAPTVNIENLDLDMLDGVIEGANDLIKQSGEASR